LSLIYSNTASDSNGLGDNIEWKTWVEAKSIAKETGKPLMPKIAASKYIEKLSSKFVMVNAKEGEQPMDEPKFNIDGQYIPRIIFLDSNENVLANVINERKPSI